VNKEQQAPVSYPKMTRAKTLGIHMQSKRTLFQWTADGQLQEVEVKVEDIETAPEPRTPSAFGKLSKNIPDGKSLLSGKSGKSAKSIASGNTEVAFSEQNYPVGEDQEPGAILFKI